jgi:hypothetical protein
MKYKTKLNGQLITGSYNEIVKYIANSGLIGNKIIKL